MAVLYKREFLFTDCRGRCGWCYVGALYGVWLHFSNYRYAPREDVSFNDGPHIRRWSYEIILLAIVLQLPTVFNTVTCCTGL